MTISLEKWQSLLSQVRVVGYLVLSSEEQLLDFESQMAIPLASEYKDFCRVFGVGEFSPTDFFIQCPLLQDQEGLLALDREVIDVHKGAYDYPIKIQQLLDNAYIFGTGQGFTLFFFDLRTYSEEDRSYDIWGISDDISYVYKIGRSFFEFIRDCCIGTKVKENFPGLLSGVSGNISFDDIAFYSSLKERL